MVSGSSAGPAIRLLLFFAIAMAAAMFGLATNAPSSSKDVKLHTRLLPDGGRIAVGSRTGHDVTVWWQKPGSTSWSAPALVQRFPKLWNFGVSVTDQGGTVAISPGWDYEPSTGDFQIIAFSTLVVCRDYRCTSSRAQASAAETSVSDDGHLVAFIDLNEDRVTVWEKGKGFRKSPVRGIPWREREILATPDGTFIGVSGRWDGSLCRIVLYSSDRGSTDFRREYESPGFTGTKPCSVGAESKGPATVHVWTDDLPHDIRLRRVDGLWTLDDRTSSQMQIPDTGGRSSMLPLEIGVGGGRTVLIGSYDGTEILIQTRAGRRAAWGPERVLARAPAGTSCHGANGQGPLGKRSMTMILIHCHQAGRPVRDPEDAGDLALVLASTNGSHWTTATLDFPMRDVLSSRQILLAVGADHTLLYRGGRSFTTVHLPVDTQWDGVALTLDGTRLIRLPGNGDPKGTCRASTTVAPLTATSWPAATPFKVGGLPRRGTCDGSIDEYAPHKFGAGIYQHSWLWEGELRWRNGHLARRPRPK